MVITNRQGRGRARARQGARGGGGANANRGVNARRGPLAWGAVAPRSRGREEVREDGGAEGEYRNEEAHTIVPNVQGEGTSGCKLVEFMKLRPPTYDGLGQPRAAEAWIDEMEKFLKAAGVGDPMQKVNFAAFHLRDKAARWWKGINVVSSVDNIEWTEFKECFYRQFFPDSAKDELRNKFEKLYQGGMSVQEYFLKFTSLARYAPELVANKEEKQRRFQRGLNPVIALKVAALVFDSFAALVEGAQQVEATMIQNRRIWERSGRPMNAPGGRREDRKRPWEAVNNRGSQPQGGKRSFTPSTSFTLRTNNISKGDQRAERKCFTCGDFRHQRFECPRIQCRACNLFGHFARNCPGAQPRIETNRPFNQPRLPVPPQQRPVVAPRVQENRGGGSRRNNAEGSQKSAAQNSQPAQGRVFSLAGESNPAEPSSVRDSSFVRPQSSDYLSRTPSRTNSMYSQDPGGVGNSRSSFTYEEIVEATRGFSKNNILGEGGFGCVFKGVLVDGREIAVKQLKATGGQGEREFRAEVEIISRVHHRHLVSLVGYCISESQRLLVLAFVPNGTLHYHLHSKSRPVMRWEARVRVAAGAARGLAYLHEDCHPRIIHRDIKSSNILLDINLEAQVADFGLAKLTTDTNTHVSTRVMGTFGYLAPEYAASGKLTEKSDVFSFGVVLLELITGRVPVDSSQPCGDESLVEWARPLLTEALENENFDELVDSRLGKNYVASEMFRMVEAAAACIRHSALKRPKMSQVVRALDSLDEISGLSNGAKIGESVLFNSREQSAQIKMFQKTAFGSQEYSSGFSDRSRNGWKS